MKPIHMTAAVRNVEPGGGRAVLNITGGAGTGVLQLNSLTPEARQLFEAGQELELFVHHRGHLDLSVIEKEQPLEALFHALELEASRPHLRPVDSMAVRTFTASIRALLKV